MTSDIPSGSEPPSGPSLEPLGAKIKPPDRVGEAFQSAIRESEPQSAGSVIRNPTDARQREALSSTGERVSLAASDQRGASVHPRHTWSREMQEQLRRGIEILPSQRSNFQNKNVVLLDDPDFQRAFETIFFPKLDQSVFHWRLVP